jgi:hypothetical protein
MSNQMVNAIDKPGHTGSSPVPPISVVGSTSALWRICPKTLRGRSP